jgi:hypothetical protein
MQLVRPPTSLPLLAATAAGSAVTAGTGAEQLGYVVMSVMVVLSTENTELLISLTTEAGVLMVCVAACDEGPAAGVAALAAAAVG